MESAVRNSNGYVQYYMLTEILERLSVKSLLRFRCASKSLCTFIKSPAFILKQHRYRGANGNNTNNVLLARGILPPPLEADVFSVHDMISKDLKVTCPNLCIPFFKDLLPDWEEPRNQDTKHRDLVLLGPSNGIICIVYAEYFVLCNPALREFKLIQQCPSCSPEDYMADPEGYGFGYINHDDHPYNYLFKIVLVNEVLPLDDYAYGDDIAYLIQLYNSNTNSWKLLNDWDDDPLKLAHISGYADHLFFKDACHWSANTQDSGDFVVLSFNLRTEVFREIEFPKCVEITYINLPRIMVLNDCLALIRFERGETELVDVWVLKEYDNLNWTKQFVIGPYLITRVLCYWKKDEWLLAETDNGKLAAYPIHTNDHDSTTVTFPVQGTSDALRCLILKQSLISLNYVSK